MARAWRGLSVAAALALVGACGKPEPLYFTDFMEDRFAREGTLARCNQDRDATLDDIECANARRAAAAIALREEQERRQQLEQESERKLAELRAEVERHRSAVLEAQARAEAAARAAYEAQWREGGDGLPPIGVDGEPITDPALDSAQAPLEAPAALPESTPGPEAVSPIIE